MKTKEDLTAAQEADINSIYKRWRFLCPSATIYRESRKTLYFMKLYRVNIPVANRAAEIARELGYDAEVDSGISDFTADCILRVRYNKPKPEPKKKPGWHPPEVESMRIVTLDKEGMIHDVAELSIDNILRKDGSFNSIFTSLLKKGMEEGYRVSLEKVFKEEYYNGH